MPEADVVRLLTFFKAMANESRLKLVGLLATGERTVQELAELTGLKEPTVSHHLTTLKSLGLVSVRPEGVMRWHALRPEALAEMNRTLLDPGGAMGMAAPKADWEEKVLASFLDAEGRLKIIPASRRKRWVVLKWLVRQFKEGRRYREAEVNEIIQRRHWDSATLRRELIGHAMMTREAGVYTRLPEAEWKGFGYGEKPEET